MRVLFYTACAIAALVIQDSSAILLESQNQNFSDPAPIAVPVPSTKVTKVDSIPGEQKIETSNQ